MRSAPPRCGTPRRSNAHHYRDGTAAAQRLAGKRPRAAAGRAARESFELGPRRHPQPAFDRCRPRRWSTRRRSRFIKTVALRRRRQGRSGNASQKWRRKRAPARPGFLAAFPLLTGRPIDERPLRCWHPLPTHGLPGRTHEPFNLGSPGWSATTQYRQDRALVEAVHHEGAAWADESLGRFRPAHRLRPTTWSWACWPTSTCPSWTRTTASAAASTWCTSTPHHQLMRTAIEQGIHASPYADPRPGAHVARRAYVPAEPGRGRPRLPG